MLLRILRSAIPKENHLLILLNDAVSVLKVARCLLEWGNYILKAYALCKP